MPYLYVQHKAHVPYPYTLPLITYLCTPYPLSHTSVYPTPYHIPQYTLPLITYLSIPYPLSHTSVYPTPYHIPQYTLPLITYLSIPYPLPHTLVYPIPYHVPLCPAHGTCTLYPLIITYLSILYTISHISYPYPIPLYVQHMCHYGGLL